MNAIEKKTMFDQVRMNIHFADQFATELHRSSSITPNQASCLLELCTKANSSCQAWERVMRGVEPPKVG